MPCDYSETEAVGLVGMEVEARHATPNAVSGETGEVVRADPYQERFIICVEWSGAKSPRFDEFTKGESLHFLKLKRR